MNVYKLAKKELPKYGAVLEHESNKTRQQTWRMPGGSPYIVGRHSTPNAVRDVIESLKAWMSPLRGFEEDPNAPKLNGARATGHFMKRFDLMADQAELTIEEVREACLRPKGTYYSGERQRWAYESGRIIVVAGHHGGQMRLVTVLWANQRLWDLNPRPEREARSA